MTERRLPPALAEQEDEAGCWDEIESVVSTSAILDWLYGTEKVCPSCERVWDGFCKDCSGGKVGTPGLVERVEQRAYDLLDQAMNEERLIDGDKPAWVQALRQELGMEEA